MSIPEVSSRNRLLQFLKRYFSSVSFSAIVAPNAVIQGFLKNEGLATEQLYRVSAPTTTANANGDFTADGSILLSLNSGDTVCAQVYYVDAGSATEQIFGNSDDQYQYSQFYGFKV